MLLLWHLGWCLSAWAIHGACLLADHATGRPAPCRRDDPCSAVPAAERARALCTGTHVALWSASLPCPLLPGAVYMAASTQILLLAALTIATIGCSSLWYLSLPPFSATATSAHGGHGYVPVPSPHGGYNAVPASMHLGDHAHVHQPTMEAIPAPTSLLTSSAPSEPR